MPKYIREKVYFYHELTDQAKHGARFWYRSEESITRHSNDWVMDKAERLGIKIHKMDTYYFTIKGEFIINAADCIEQITKNQWECKEIKEIAENFLQVLSGLDFILEAVGMMGGDKAQEMKRFFENKFLNDLLLELLRKATERRNFCVSEDVIEKRMNENKWTFTKKGERRG